MNEPGRTNEWMSGWMGGWINQSINQSVSQSVNLSINQSKKEPVSQSVDRTSAIQWFNKLKSKPLTSYRLHLHFLIARWFIGNNHYQNQRNDKKSLLPFFLLINFFPIPTTSLCHNRMRKNFFLKNKKEKKNINNETESFSVWYLHFIRLFSNTASKIFTADGVCNGKKKRK